jgi:hypothetical protein
VIKTIWVNFSSPAEGVDVKTGALRSVVVTGARRLGFSDQCTVIKRAMIRASPRIHLLFCCSDFKHGSIHQPHRR